MIFSLSEKINQFNITGLHFERKQTYKHFFTFCFQILQLMLVKSSKTLLGTKASPVLRRWNTCTTSSRFGMKTAWFHQALLPTILCPWIRDIILNGDSSTLAPMQGRPSRGRAGAKTPGAHHLVRIWTFLNVDDDIFVFVLVSSCTIKGKLHSSVLNLK